jgi:hypothetical protein
MIKMGRNGKKKGETFSASHVGSGSKDSKLLHHLSVVYF